MWFCHKISTKNATYSINLSSQPISSFYLGDFAQRTVETGPSVFFMIKSKASKSMSLYAHMYINPRQKFHGSRNSENKTLLMSAGSAVKLGN